MGLRLKTVTQNTNANYILSNTADEQLNLAITKQRQITVTTADVDLTTGSEHDVNSQLYKALRSVRLEFIGAMTAARSVILPDEEKFYLVKMSCTGGFTLTVKTAAGSGVALVDGDKKLLICDGADIEDALA